MYDSCHRPFSCAESPKFTNSDSRSQLEAWVNLLFDPSDIIEVRAFPAKQLTETQRPLKYVWAFTRRHHLFHPWRRASELLHVTEQLDEFNRPEGVETVWAVKESGDWDRITVLDHVRLAQLAGLNVGVALCPECPLFRTCRYQVEREKARNASHAVATHARASHSDFSIAQDKQLVFVHENCLNLLRPTVRVGAREGGPGEASAKHLKDVVKVAREAVYLAEAWDDPQKQSFFLNLIRCTQELIAAVESKEAMDDLQQAQTPQKVAAVARARNLPLKPRLARPDRCDYALYRGMQAADLHLHGAALRLALAHACGELEHLALVTDDAFAKPAKGQKGAQRQYHQAVVGVWKVDPPEGSVVWFEDATGNPKVLSQLLGSRLSHIAARPSARSGNGLNSLP